VKAKSQTLIDAYKQAELLLSDPTFELPHSFDTLISEVNNKLCEVPHSSVLVAHLILSMSTYFSME